jgi:hypothetical protein
MVPVRYGLALYVLLKSASDSRWLMYEGDSINSSQMDIDCKTCDIGTWVGRLFLDISFTNIGWTCPIALPVRRNPQSSSLLPFVSDNSAPPFHHLRLLIVLERISRRICKRFTLQTLPTVNRNHFFTFILCIESFCYKERTTERCSLVTNSLSMITVCAIR